MRTCVRFIAITVLVASLCLASLSTLAFAQSTNLPTAEEYTDGTIVNQNLPFNIAYDWVNVSGTQVLYYAAYTAPNYTYPLPIANVIGQHLHQPDGTEVFIASALDGMEVYRDANGDGVPQANFAEGQSEILYFMYTNMSDNYNITPLQKQTQNGVDHYTWAFTYEGVYAYLQNASTHIGVYARFKLDHLTLSYDFSVDGNVSNLKTNFDIGNVENMQVFDATTSGYVDSTEAVLEGLSLSLLYATATYTSQPYTVLVNGQNYNSSTAQNPAVNTDLAQVAVNDTSIYDFVFGGNYTLSNTTYAAPLQTYEAKAEAAPLTSLPIPKQPTIWALNLFADQLNLTQLFGGSWPSINANYEASSLIYRICFPVWDGQQIVHDPVYVGYLAGSAEPIPEIPQTVVLVVVAGLVAATLVIASARKINTEKREPSSHLRQGIPKPRHGATYGS